MNKIGRLLLHQRAACGVTTGGHGTIGRSVIRLVPGLVGILCLPVYSLASLMAFSMEVAPHNVKNALFRSPGQIDASFLPNSPSLSSRNSA